MSANLVGNMMLSTSASTPNVDVLTTHIVADIGHDLCNLLSNTKIHLYLTLRSPDQLSEHLTVLESLVYQLEALARQLLIVSQPERDIQARPLYPLNLNEIMARVIKVFEPVSALKKQHLILDAATDLLPLLADELDIERVVTNLLYNALEYTPEAGTIYLTTSQTCDSVTLTVKDTGIGISTQALPHIFERSYRSPEAQRAAPGIGLGLAIVRGLVEKYGGHIEVESSLGIGSIFNVIFPTRVND